ncbi:transglutaminase-like domain-containing protein [Dawidia soli]|uniref:Transglutaminase-like domain-containing protein n=1 Tax=Dawidia soli TaxID=2782352 RepID=A0AAP2DF14_9BACT|nr:transglutaminase-like domain-containing protein [Dawidia soli]MBT1690798.1 transglutaminase-like domain-containing protein [Dawidia soli]
MKDCKVYFAATLAVVCLTLVPSCSRGPNEVSQALEYAGSNRSELEKVIGHYSQRPGDSLKLRAARFLIANMPGHHFYKGKIIDQLHQFFDIANTVHPKWPAMDLRPLGDSLQRVYGSIWTGNVETLYDLESLPANYLIENIDEAFRVWREQPWCQHVTFDQFCEFILPYRVDNEDPFEYNRKAFYARFNPLLDTVRNTNGDAVAACLAVNNELKKGMWVFTGAMEHLPHFGAQTILDKRVGVCREYADLAVYAMRATGIPVAIDFTPQWPFRSLGHSWNVLLSEAGKKIMFLGIESDPGQPHKADHKKAKVYRNTFALQSKSLAMTANGADIPELFRNPRFIDVSDEYFEGVDVSIPLDKSEDDAYAYLCVFDNKNWVPVQWGKVVKGTAVFAKMGRDIVYLPAYYKGGRIVPANAPFLLTKDGELKFYVTDQKKKQDLRLFRKFPILTVRERMVRVKGGKFQGANRADFKDSITLYKISEPSIFYQSAKVKNRNRFRYLRYLSPPHSNGNIAEIEFYSDSDSSHALKGNVIGDKEVGDPARGREQAMDGNVLTFYDARKEDSPWVGIDVGSAKTITKIRYIATNDGNNIAPGNEYELLYFDKDIGWRSIGRQTAVGYELQFNNVPAEVLYLLHNHTEGVEERIFTYENGEQVWW